MAMIPHICEKNCKHKVLGRHCGFYTGDMYYLGCVNSEAKDLEEYLEMQKSKYSKNRIDNEQD